jgi:hypothetical protein
MPKALERKLKKEASDKFPNDEERQDAYVYGTMRKTGWTPSTQKKRKVKTDEGKWISVGRGVAVS